MIDNGETQHVLNRVQDELVKLRRERRRCTTYTVIFLALEIAALFTSTGGESDFMRATLLILVWAGVVDLRSIHRSIRMMESVATMFPKRISGSDASAP